MIPSLRRHNTVSDGSSSNAGRTAAVRNAAHWLFVLAVCGYLVYKLSGIGWHDVLLSLPVTPWFYILFVSRYLCLPLFEILIYRRFWDFSVLRSVPVFLRKRVYNLGVFDYSGEAYFYLWAKKNSRPGDNRAFSIIKDVNIVSAVVSAAATLVLVVALLETDTMQQISRMVPDAELYIYILAVAGAVGGCLLYAFRRRVMAFSAADVAVVSALHAGRLLLVLLLYALQWWSAVPSVPAAQWLFFLTLYMVLGRLPLVPNKDLVFLVGGVALAGAVTAEETSVSAMFLANLALLQVANAVVYLATSFNEHSTIVSPTGERKSDHS